MTFRRSPSPRQGAFGVLFVAGLGVAVLMPSQARAAGGDTLWESRFSGPGNHYDSASSSAVSTDGTVFVTGLSFGVGSDFDYVTVAYDGSSGVELWTARYTGPGSGVDSPYSIAVSPDGARVFVTGESSVPGKEKDYATVAYDASTGSVLWGRRYNGPASGFDSARSVTVSPGGDMVFATGYSEGSGSGRDFATVAYDAATGATLWGKRYNDPLNGDDVATFLAVGAGGTRLFVTGETGPGFRTAYTTVAYDAADGSVLWIGRYNGSRDEDSPVAVAASQDGAAVFVTGSSLVVGVGNDYATVAYDAATGATLWSARYDGPAAGADEASSLTVSPDSGLVYVSGSSIGSGSDDDYATVAYLAATGTEAWAARFNGLGNDRDLANSMAVSKDGSKVFVTGSSVLAPTGTHYATVAYDAAAGTTLWIRSYNGPGPSGDTAESVTVSPDGASVVVTGGSPGSGSGFDFATIAYEA